MDDIVVSNTGKSKEWYLLDLPILKERAMEKRDASSMWKLGYVYEHGEGVAQNEAMAEFWYSEAATQDYFNHRNKNLKELAKNGNKKAMAQLVTVYKKGEGVKVDLKKAEYWRERLRGPKND